MLLGEFLARRPAEEDFEGFEDAVEAWEAWWEVVMFAPECSAGAVVICHLGCARREWLVISGRYRGTVWSDCRVDDVGLVPLLRR
ncbi:hypothetical protein [Streptomyces griseoluteus]|uniref:hypothetical protein n=1 Tax=Streptomyces griseoluteus TaxID=29306 RepID=UPI0036E002DD